MIYETNNEYDETEEVETTETEESTEKENPMDYKIIVDMIKEMDEQYKMLKEFTEDSISNTYGLNPEILTAILPYKMEDIDTLDDNELSDFLTKYSKDSELADISNMTHAELVELMKTVKTSSLNLLSSKAEADEIKRDSNGVLKEYFNYLSSTTVQEKRAKRLQAMKEAAEETTDSVKKQQMLRMINTMESAQSLSFLFNRFNEYGASEIKSIKVSFFDKRKGSYIIDKYKAKVSKFGFDHNLYRYFFNIEENFLEEKYHAFNNLFLFIYMRFVAHADAYNKQDVMFVQSLTSSMANLIYHRFDSTVNEKNFLEIIKKVLDNFIDYYDYFIENNSTQPTHPLRIQADNKRNAERREALIKKMNELKITGYDENATADELQTYMNEALDTMIKEQTKKDEPEEVESAESSDETDVIDETDTVDVTADYADIPANDTWKEEKEDNYVPELNPPV